MKTIQEILSDCFIDSINQVFPNLDNINIEIISTNNPNFGDYQTNIAMQLKKHIEIKNPREIAQKIIDRIVQNGYPPSVKKIEVAGPGFINIFLNNQWIAMRAKQTIQDERLGAGKPGVGKTTLIDFSSPNIAKTMHIGHLRSTIIGAALYRIHEFSGYNVVGDNHIGDWGTQFGKLIVAYNKWLDEEALKNDPVAELERLYVEFGKQAEKDPSLQDEARKELVKLQKGDKKNTQLWKKFVSLSMQRFNEIYDRMDIHFDVVYGESHYKDMLNDIVDMLKEKGLAVKSEGAYVIFLEDKNLPPYLVQKSDGAFLYSTTDIAGLRYRIEKWHPETIIVVTDNRQEMHFKQLKVVAEKLGWDKETELVHVSFGRLNFAGEIMATRTGNVVKLKDLLDEAHKKAKEVVEEASPHLTEVEKDNIAETVGISTIKYFDLSQNRTSDITFDWVSSLALQGNTATYLLYAYARIRSIFRKYKEETSKDIDNIYDYDIKIVNDDEARVIKEALKFPWAVNLALKSYKPNVICDFIYNLSQEFNTFYNKHRVINAKDNTPESRLLICDLVGKTIKKGLELLTITPLERM
jgi:arginyl-tRNA synthetase